MDAAQALIEALSATDDSLRHAALQAVERLSDPQLLQAVPALAKLAENPAEDDAYRCRAVRAIAKLQSNGEAATSQLVELGRRSDSLNLRRACFFALAKIAPAKQAEEFFQGQLGSDVPADLRRLAVKWLGTVAGGDQSLQSLADALADQDQAVRLQAIDALVAIGKPALPILIKALDAPNVRHAAPCGRGIGQNGVSGRRCGTRPASPPR